MILIYDVRRWGRFQDSDEAAAYEFLCKSAGIPALLCRTVLERRNTAEFDYESLEKNHDCWIQSGIVRQVFDGAGMVEKWETNPGIIA